MKKDLVLKILKDRETELKARGVTHAALFGSVARGDGSATSDIDIMIELDDAVVTTVFGYSGVKTYISHMFDEPVDVVDRQALKPAIRPQAERDAIYAF